MKSNLLLFTSCIGMFFLYSLYIDVPEVSIQAAKNTLSKKNGYITPESCAKSQLTERSHNLDAPVSTRRQQNTVPVVKILIPENNALFEWNTLIRYAVSISDEEDGKSEYGEIAANEVSLEVIYVSDTAKAAAFLTTDTTANRNLAGLAVIKSSDCFNCHAVKTKLQGPAFSDVAKRYPHNSSTVEMLAQRVIKGNAGAWGNVAMPPHPDVTQIQARQIIQWILENVNDPNRDYYAGLEGTFRTKAKPEGKTTGIYILSASYTDHGSKEQPQLRYRGQHTVVLHSK